MNCREINKMAQVSLRNSPAMQLKDVTFKVIQGHLSWSHFYQLGLPHFDPFGSVTLGG
jgi:hypothetical protein